MMKYKRLVFPLFLILVSISNAQDKYEREHRIRKSQFPTLKQDLIIPDSNLKQQRFYKEVDNAQTIYTMKFKQDRIRYFMDFDQEGELTSVGFRVNEIDMPSDVHAFIESYLEANFKKIKLRRMFQEYQVTHEKPAGAMLKDAFQNLMLPNAIYRLIFMAKKDRKRKEYEALFDAEGNFKKIRLTLPANYDHVLY